MIDIWFQIVVFVSHLMFQTFIY